MRTFMSDKPKDFWDGLETKEQLYEVFNDTYESNENAKSYLDGQFNFKEGPITYKDNELPEVAKKLKKAAEPLLPVLRDIVKHLPDKVNNSYTAEAAAREWILDLKPYNPDGLAITAWLLLLTLEGKVNGNIITCIETGNNIPTDRAAARAFARFKAYKKKEMERRAAFEQTQEFRTQRIEVALGIRDHIEYPVK